MSMQFSSAKVDFELGTLTSPAPAKAREDTPFCMAILADFSGRGNRGLCETGPSLASRRAVRVDVDNIESLPARFGTELYIPVGAAGSSIAISFSELDDFHPDRIFDSVEIFQKLKSTRRRLLDSATFAEAAAEVQSWAAGQGGEAEPSQADSAADDSPESEESDTDTIERLLGKSPSIKQPSAPERRSADIESLIREVVKPYIVPAPDSRQADLVAQVDEAISGQMRAILHHPDFQAVEAAWRNLHFLVSRVETDEMLRMYAFDVSKAELAADLAGAANLESSGIYRLLAERSAGVQGAEPWAVLVAGYTFDKTEQDIELLRNLGGVAQAAGAPLLAAAGSHFAGCESIATTPEPEDWRWQAGEPATRRWQELRRSPEANFIGLALPRFLLRLPYGKETEPIDRFDFQELSGVGDHERYLWGNPAGIIAYLLAAAFSEYGWRVTEGLGSDVGGLPMHVCKSEAETDVTPCAETFLSERAVRVLIDKGLMPVLSIKGQDAVRAPRFQSIAEPASPLAGRWR
ncbi:MAG TPA: type VI secretion system contractile sheath large subunit [Sedimentisphaerales bacterium]|nr:type VI secretion system contractile sheath large subunit [Sedimentisphaerales bacterium]